MFVYDEKEWPGHLVRVHRPAAHRRRDEHSEEEVPDNILPQVAPQQLKETAGIRVSRAGHTTPHDPQQQSVCCRRVLPEFDR